MIVCSLCFYYSILSFQTMQLPLWAAFFSLLLVVNGDDGAVEPETEEDDKDAFVPIKFTPPQLGTMKPHFLEYFPGKDAIGKRWIKSTAKKDGVDSEIAKYNGT